MRIALCDDDPELLSELQRLLDDYAVQNACALSVDRFSCAADLTEAVRTAPYDIYLLDVVMPAVNGIDAARKIREEDKNARILFLTSSAEFAVESYAVHASAYLLKPVSKTALYQSLDEILQSLAKEKDDCILVREQGNLRRLNLRHLEYCEIYSHTIFYHMDDKQVIEASGSFAELEESLLLRGKFIRPHRSYIVNLDFVSTVQRNCLYTAGGGCIPIPARKAAEIRNAVLLHFEKSEGGVFL